MPEPLRLSAGFAALALALALPLGCSGPPPELIAAAQYRNWRKMQPLEPEPARVVVRDPETGERVADRAYLDLSGGTRVNHGAHRTWFADGQPATLRSFQGGEPIGAWWTWWKGSGLLRSAYVFDADRETRMVWWHANGRLASEGLAERGSRQGHWRFWHENGALASEGDFVGGRRDGPWVFYDEVGLWTERGTYRGGLRVGDWSFRGAPDR